MCCALRLPGRRPRPCSWLAPAAGPDLPRRRSMMAGVLGELGDEAAGHRSLVVLRVDALNAYCEEITLRGARILHGPAPMTDRMRVAHLKDPEGNLVELQEWLLLRT
ncbi:lyase [Streptomyces viridochromogenes DSM 40736]|uniref:Lyase n=1 Tax=Streptomyces viridochromogenes (strain DSM 40736 / JCM 4977 / BCRC 1201 / Tue 494) TaxID=591159 RepID=D9X838_STRVT|nr:lyase [Streptomyces viridochromogenes DSM 40736]